MTGAGTGDEVAPGLVVGWKGHELVSGRLLLREASNDPSEDER